jgi:probable F420-dependent oxidoreductase
MTATDRDGQRCRVGVQLWPQATTMDALRRAAREIDDAGLDSLWTWDHFFPLTGDPDASHFEAWTTLTAFAVDTSRVQLGLLVGCNSYRNPHLVADMARTVDHISGGRAVLGLGSGWFQRDYDEYEIPFGTAGARLRDLESSLYRIRRRLAQLVPPPVGELPILIGGGGEQVTLRLVAEYADMWNGYGTPAEFAHKNAVLDRWCERLERDPTTIERTVHIGADEVDRVDDYVTAGAQHVIVRCEAPFDLDPVLSLHRAVQV